MGTDWIRWIERAEDSCELTKREVNEKAAVGWLEGWGVIALGQLVCAEIQVNVCEPNLFMAVS